MATAPTIGHGGEPMAPVPVAELRLRLCGLPFDPEYRADRLSGGYARRSHNATGALRAVCDGERAHAYQVQGAVAGDASHLV